MAVGVCVDEKMLKDTEIDFRILWHIHRVSRYDGVKSISLDGWLETDVFYKRYKNQKDENIIMSYPTFRKKYKILKETTAYKRYFEYDKNLKGFNLYTDLNHNPDKNYIVIVNNDYFDKIFELTKEYKKDYIIRLFLLLYKKSHDYADYGGYKKSIGSLCEEIGVVNSTSMRDKIKKMINELQDLIGFNYTIIIEKGRDDRERVERFVFYEPILAKPKDQPYA